MSVPTDTVPHPTRARRRLPLVAGSVIVAAGLVFGGLTVADASNTPAGRPQQHQTGYTTDPIPTKGDSIANVGVVENQIKAYYGAVNGGTATVAGASVTLTNPDPDGNYADEVHRIEAKTKSYLATAVHKGKKPALVFDVDDTTLNTYNYEVYSSFAYNPSTNAEFVNQGLFPEVYGMPALVNWAKAKGYTVFFLTGRPTTQRDGTVANLKKVGYRVPTDVAHLYLKPTAADPKPDYLPCATISACTTTQYKSSTRAHIESLGYHIVADFGDQYSDLNGGYAGKTVKLPNPMYYLP